MADLEKHHVVKIEEAQSAGQKEGYLLDARKLDSEEGLKVSKDGRIVLFPQPTADPNDPLNWSRVRKNLILFIISATAFLPDYGSATGAVTLIPQAESVLTAWSDSVKCSHADGYLQGVAYERR